MIILWTLRSFFLIGILGIATGLAIRVGHATESTTSSYLAFCTTMLLGGAVVALDVFTKHKRITTFSAIYLGMLIGLTLAHLLIMALTPILAGTVLDTQGDLATSAKSAGDLGLLRIFLTFLFCYGCVSTLLQTKDDFRFIIPYVEFSKQFKGPKAFLLDTSVIIDGRIADICDTRFIDTKLIVARFVLHELQSVADSQDRLKRNRGRRGMDILKRMQNNPKVELEIHEGQADHHNHAVDEQLVALAKSIGARVVTNDYNLNKMAQLEGVEVVNINELANALKSVALPGEHLHVRLIKPGDQAGQGIGYLDDGTMVVAEYGRQHLGQEVSICVTSVLQTPAGRMIFGRVEPVRSTSQGREKETSEAASS
jgi:uncharacterized protein YacL